MTSLLVGPNQATDPWWAKVLLRPSWALGFGNEPARFSFVCIMFYCVCSFDCFRFVHVVVVRCCCCVQAMWRMEQQLQRSDIDYTIVRPSGMNSSLPKGFEKMRFTADKSFTEPAKFIHGLFSRCFLRCCVVVSIVDVVG